MWSQEPLGERKEFWDDTVKKGVRKLVLEQSAEAPDGLIDDFQGGDNRPVHVEDDEVYFVRIYHQSCRDLKSWLQYHNLRAGGQFWYVKGHFAAVHTGHVGLALNEFIHPTGEE